MRFVVVLLGALGALLPTAPATADQPDPELVLVLDSSGSMAEQDASGAAKIDTARKALDAVIDGLGDGEKVGMRVFGATVEDASAPGACSDSQLVVPIAGDNRADLKSAVRTYSPLGETPIAYALGEAGKDLGRSGKRSVLLVSDGLATCDLDPCDTAADLAKQGVDLTINVVGFGVDARAREQLQCIAHAGNGSYFDAQDAESLTAAMDRVAARAFRPFSVSGKPVHGAPRPKGAPVLRSGGQYTDVVGSKGVKKHYLLRRKLAGSSVHVGMSMIPQKTGQVGMHVESLDGDACGWDYVQTSTGGSESWSLMTGQVTVWPENARKDNPCRDSGTLVLTVEMTTWYAEIEGTPYEIVVREEPRVANLNDLPAKQDDRDIPWQAMTVRPGGGKAVGGSSFNDALRLKPGSYRTDVLPGETIFFRVPLDWGQQVQVWADFPRPGPALAKAIDNAQMTRLFVASPLRGNVTPTRLAGSELGYSEAISEQTTTTLATASPSVRWMNRSSVNAPELANLAGDYYVALSVDRDEDGESYVIPLTLTIAVTGKAGDGAPTYDQSGNTPPKADHGSDLSEDTPDGLSPVVLAGLGAAGVLLLGAIAFAVLRRRR